jgi:hypothetical protein
MHKLRSFIIAIITFVIITILLCRLHEFVKNKIEIIDSICEKCKNDENKVCVNDVCICKKGYVWLDKKRTICGVEPIDTTTQSACEKCKSNENKVCVNDVCICKKGYVWLDKKRTICGVPKPPIKPTVTVTSTYETQPIRIRTTITKEIDHKTLDVVLSFPLDKKAFLNTNPKLRLKVVRSSDQKPVFTKFCNVQDGWNKVVIPKSNFIDNYGGLYTATLYYGDTENVAHVDFRPTE